MIEFKINKEDITQVVEFFVKKYEIEPAMVEAIYKNIKNTPSPQENEEEEKYFKELEESYVKKNYIFDKDKADETKLQRAQTINISKRNVQIYLDIGTRSKSLKKKSLSL